ncbi:MAG: AAA family ATPase [Selenomonadaceae bacterium]|nr:AAA family ATPase [Selenomonadaceae bacterium]
MPRPKFTMPIGVDNFQALREKNYYFVDKTRFIKELLDGHSAVTLLTRPRRFGKTLTLSMLRYFFTVEKAEGNRALFAGLDIEKAGEEYMQAQGSRPVIFLTLKEVQQDSFDFELQKMAFTLSRLYQEFLFLQDSPAMNKTNLADFQQILNHTAGQPLMENALADLCRYLYLHYGKKPILLLDEYDAPIIASWEYDYYKDCILFMKRFLGVALKTNDYLDFAVLTGVSRVSKESIFSDLNNLNVCSILSYKYSDILGFTDSEAEKLLSDNGVGNKMPELKMWYDGYQFGNTEIYNPWSVIKYVDNNCTFAPYWLNTSGNVILRELLKRVDGQRREELTSLVSFKTVKAMIDEGVIYPEIKENTNALYMMLMTSGYLKAVKQYQDRNFIDWCLLKIPNREVLSAYKREILTHLTGRAGEVLLYNMLDAMTEGRAADFQKYLRRVLRDMVSYHDTGEPEIFYHGLMLGLTVLMEGAYRVKSNRESGYGRFDIAFFPVNIASPGVILELKAAKGITATGDLQPLAEEALKQIRGKEYIAELTEQGVKEIWRYGVAFSGKLVCLVSNGKE